MNFPAKRLVQEADFKAVTSGGPGGQHANKASTKVQLDWNVSESQVFDETQKERIIDKLSKRLTKEGVLQLASGSTRSQHKNKEIVTKRFLRVLKGALQKPKQRKKTKKPKSADRKRLDKKRQQAEKKKNRKDPLG